MEWRERPIEIESNISIGRINTLFSLFHQEKRDINDAVSPGASEI